MRHLCITSYPLPCGCVRASIQEALFAHTYCKVHRPRVWADFNSVAANLHHQQDMTFSTCAMYTCFAFTLVAIMGLLVILLVQLPFEKI